ncbi:dehydrogenase/reductase SDR family member 11-like [Planococcus citri]|uniref:dehydrogenase/reductase SDR family member 11-like n=1 Tax=Planococcus citri TaxID=170843 RepID=UPI0031F7EF4A
MDKWRGKTAIITGANSGIGATITRNFLQNGINVIAWDKEVEFLQELKEEKYGGDSLTILQTDITEDDQVQSSIDTMAENNTDIHLFIHSAGIIENNSLIDGEFSEWTDVLNTNLLGTCVCVKAVVNLMLQQNIKNGQVILITSKSGVEEHIGQRGHYYAAIDRGIMAAAQGLRYELKDRKSPIKVTTLNAGLVRTNLFKSDIAKAFLNMVVPLTTDDVMEGIEYILNSPSNVQINRLVIAGRGFIKQHLFQTPGDKIHERLARIIKRRQLN